MDEPTSVKPAKCCGHCYCESQKSPDLHGLPGKAIEGLTCCVLDYQHRPPGVAHKLHRAQRPGSVKVVLKFVFVSKTIDAFERRMVGAGKNRNESVPGALRNIARQSAEGTSGVLPQY